MLWSEMTSKEKLNLVTKVAQEENSDRWELLDELNKQDSIEKAKGRKGIYVDFER